MKLVLRTWILVLGGLLGMILPGCVGPTGLGQTYNGSLSADMGDSKEPIPPRLTRLQRSENTDVKYRGQPQGPPPEALPPPGSTLPPSMPKSFKISVRAWVNGKPLFDDEVFQGLPPQVIQELQRMPEAQRNEKLKEYAEKQLDTIIDQELMYQDAISKLEKVNPKALDKLRSLAQQDYEKQIKRIRENNKISEDQLRDLSKLLQRKVEREFIAMEYMRSRIFPKITHIIGPNEVLEYYRTHRNEFQKPETVKWQDVFLAVGPKYPTLAHAQRYAENLIAACRNPQDFERLIPLDEGDSKFRGGEGLGNRKGEIKPAEVERCLFQLREGDIGPVIPISTGVHLVRLVKHDPGGMIPFDEKIQLQIRNRLRNEVADRELKRLIRELRARAVIEIEQD